MSLKILTHNIAGIDAFVHDPCSPLNDAEDGIIAVFSDNAPAFYAITAVRLAQLLNLEAHITYPIINVASDRKSFEKPIIQATAPMEKFAMYSNWQPDADFQRQAASWGIALMQPVKREELTAFIVWWQAEKKVFTQIQWQQKLARSLQIGRASNYRKSKRDINILSQPDTQIPQGFRGEK